MPSLWRASLARRIEPDDARWTITGGRWKVASFGRLWWEAGTIDKIVRIAKIYCEAWTVLWNVTWREIAKAKKI
jgi:hypothetical protein